MEDRERLHKYVDRIDYNIFEGGMEDVIHSIKEIFYEASEKSVTKNIENLYIDIEYDMNFPIFIIKESRLETDEEYNQRISSLKEQERKRKKRDYNLLKLLQSEFGSLDEYLKKMEEDE